MVEGRADSMKEEHNGDGRARWMKEEMIEELVDEGRADWMKVEKKSGMD
jgi:hypothetical protein